MGYWCLTKVPFWIKSICRNIFSTQIIAGGTVAEPPPNSFSLILRFLGGTVGPPTRLVPPTYMILHVKYACPPAREVPPRRRKSPRTAPPSTFSYSLTLRSAAAPTRSYLHPHNMSPDSSISHLFTECPPPQQLPP